MSKQHIYRYDGDKYWRRPYDVWSEKYLPKWERLDIWEMIPLELVPIEAGKKFPLLP